ncbi:uncharacterized protein LOC135204231 [Macrobrachium nipponense]|uniref:uncharacterized protein LOC135204231 n=1 Tax=Macrobrachium nipponense TaxID=159736 RepID=UPI0030C85DAB
MASAVDVGLDEGKVVDEYFSFIYDEPTDDTFSIASDREVDDNLLDSDGVIFQSTDDPVNQSDVVDGGLLRSVKSDKVFDNVDVRSSAKPDDGKAKSDIVGNAPEGNSSVKGGLAWTVLNDNSRNETASEYKKSKERARTDRCHEQDSISDGDNSGAITPVFSPTVSINVMPPEPTHKSNLGAAHQSQSSSSTYISNNGDGSCSSRSSDGREKSLINLLPHLPEATSAQPEVAKDSDCSSNGSQEDFHHYKPPSAGSRFIYVNGEWDAKSTSVYLNGEGEEGSHAAPDAPRDAPNNAAVTIKVSQESSPVSHPLPGESDNADMDSNFDRFLEELRAAGIATLEGETNSRKPNSPINLATNASDIGDLGLPASIGKGEKLVTDFAGGGSDNKVLDVGSIECEILDELFRGMRTKEEEKEGQFEDISFEIDKEMSDLTDALSRCQSLKGTERGVMGDLPFESQVKDEPAMGSDLGSFGGQGIPAEECKESLVESWQYVDYVSDARLENEQNLQRETGSSIKPVAQEGAVGIKEEAIAVPSDLVYGKSPTDREVRSGDTCPPEGKLEGAPDGIRCSQPCQDPPWVSVDDDSQRNSSPEQDLVAVPFHQLEAAATSPLQFLDSGNRESALCLIPPSPSTPGQSFPPESPESVAPSSLPSLYLPTAVVDPNFSSLDSSLSPSLSRRDPESQLHPYRSSQSSLSSPSPLGFVTNPLPFSGAATPSSLNAASSSSSSSSSSTQQPSLSSLPPNLFLSPSSPLSFNPPPSLELPEILTPTPNTSDYFPDTATFDRSDDYSWQDVGAVGGGESWSHSHPLEGDAYDTDVSLGLNVRPDAGDDSDEDYGGTGLAAAVSRVVRRSMRRMRRLRLSGRRSPSRTRNPVDEGAHVSEETEVRRGLPAEPSLGLATVRSPAAASIIVTSLVAALAPPPLHAPRELLDPPPEHTPISNRSSETNQPPVETNGASRRHRRRQRHPVGGGGGGGRRASFDPPSDFPPMTPTDTMSLEVEVGGYSPDAAAASAPRRGSEVDLGRGGYVRQPPVDAYSPSAPASLDTILPPNAPGTWETAAVIPRPSLARSSSHHHHQRRRSHSTPVIVPSAPPPGGSSVANTPPMHASNVPPSSSSLSGFQEGSNSREEEEEEAASQTTPAEERARLPSRSPPRRTQGGRQQGAAPNGLGSGDTATPTPSRNVTERRRQRRRGNNSSNDSNNNSSSNNNNNNNNRNYTSTDATAGATPPMNSRNRNGNRGTRNNNARQSPRRPGHGGSSPGLSFDSERLHVQGGSWTHDYSSLMASLAVTVTTFNISRFAVLGAKFGWPFVVQWVVISFVLGLPLMTFHVTVGQYLGAGVVDMWRISPIFQGVGYSLVIAQALVGVYCTVPIAWLFIYFRDSFITNNNLFRWVDCRVFNCSNSSFSTIFIEAVPKYFSSIVLQRSDAESSWLQELGSIKYDMAVNIALIWIITLIALSRGNHSYGIVSYIVFLLPLLGYLVVCLYLASWTKDDIYINHASNFNELFQTSESWMAASREVFLVWGFHGAVLQQMSAHNKKGHPLYRDTTVLAVITTLALVLAAVTGSSCVSGLHQKDYYYKPSSFENAETAQFLTKSKSPQFSEPHQFHNEAKSNLMEQRLPGSMFHYDNFYAGIRIRPSYFHVKAPESSERSGYQSLRLGTELFPALLAINGAENISPFWSSLFYFSLLLFGIAQQLAVWRTVVEAVIRINRERLQSWEICITFLCCLFGFSAALPMATGAGIHILYFLDYVMSCGWWLMIIQLVQIFALLFVRGKPYSGQDIVGELMGKGEQCRSLWLGPLTSFAWNIIVPVGLLVLSISSFKSGKYKDVFAWGDKSYWPVWARQLASGLQLFPILLVPLVGLIQTCRYLTATDEDLFEKIQLLYRPSLRQRVSGSNSLNNNTEDSDLEGAGPQEGQEDEALTPRPYSDPPPKYTPPPSYSTATGVRFAKLLNQSLRQSMRRLRNTIRSTTEATQNGDNESAAQTNSCSRVEESTSRNTPYIPPPDYVTIVGECGPQIVSSPAGNTDPPPLYSTLDPLRRQRALAALANATTSTFNVKSDVVAETAHPVTPSLQRSNSRRESGLRRSIASGVRRSARRLAATLGVGNGDDDSTLVTSEEPISQDTQSSRDGEELHPHAYTNFEMVSQSEA